MTETNFLLQDIIGITLAVGLFAFIFIFPGYVLGWGFDLFGFKARTIIAQFVMGIFISASVMPSVLFLVYKFLSANITMGLLFVFAVLAVAICFNQSARRKKRVLSTQGIEYKIPTLTLALFWVIFAMLILVDLRIGDRLYFANNTYDLTTRVAVVNAITRTGVPPVNPSYYPGHPVLLNFLYYYWYILVSLVDQLGGRFVSAYTAMIASIIWCGFVLSASIAVYLRLRTPSENVWKKSFIAVQLLAVSGLDCILIVLAFLKEGYLPVNGQIEGWNMPIMSWMNALAWVPHHVTAAVACIFSMLLLATGQNRRLLDKFISVLLIGLAFSSAFGLSVWVMFIFGIFWMVWAVFILFQNKEYARLFIMIFGGLSGLIFALPFLTGVIGGSGGAVSGSNLPVSLYVRPFMIGSVFFSNLQPFALSAINFFLLPLNYLFELGFFFLIAVIWIQEFYKIHKDENPLYKAELLLVVVSVVVLSFAYSTIIAINDLGIRGWLPTQIVLVVWSADLIMRFIGDKKLVTPKIFRAIKSPKLIGLILGCTLVLGVVTSTLEVVSLRMWSIFVDLGLVPLPTQVSLDTHLGERTYDARLTYEYIADHTPADAIVQANPLVELDRPGGLYGTRQTIISDRTAYGVPAGIYKELVRGVGEIFLQKTASWKFIDAKCHQYSIDILIINDTDPIWESLSRLKASRLPLYENERYVLFSCGSS